MNIEINTDLQQITINSNTQYRELRDFVEKHELQNYTIVSKYVYSTPLTNPIYVPSRPLKEFPIYPFDNPYRGTSLEANSLPVNPTITTNNGINNNCIGNCNDCTC